MIRTIDIPGALMLRIAKLAAETGRETGTLIPELIEKGIKNYAVSVPRITSIINKMFDEHDSWPVKDAREHLARKGIRSSAALRAALKDAGIVSSAVGNPGGGISYWEWTRPGGPEDGSIIRMKRSEKWIKSKKSGLPYISPLTSRARSRQPRITPVFVPGII